MIKHQSIRLAKKGVKRLRENTKIITREINGVIHKTLPEGTHLKMSQNKPTVISGKNVFFTTPNGDFVSLAHGKAEYRLNMDEWQVFIPNGSRAKVVKSAEKHNTMKNGIITIDHGSSIGNEGIIDSAYGRMIVNKGGRIKKAHVHNTDSRFGLQNYSKSKYPPRGEKTVTPGRIEDVIVTSSNGEKNTLNITNDGIINNLKVAPEYAENMKYHHLIHRGKVNSSNVEIPKIHYYYDPLPGVKY